MTARSAAAKEWKRGEPVYAICNSRVTYCGKVAYVLWSGQTLKTTSDRMLPISECFRTPEAARAAKGRKAKPPAYLWLLYLLLVG